MGTFWKEPARSRRKAAVAWTTRTPAPRADARRAWVLAIMPLASTVFCSSGMHDRSPTTPRWISMVITAQRSASTRSSRRGIG